MLKSLFVYNGPVQSCRYVNILDLDFIFIMPYIAA